MVHIQGRHFILRVAPAGPTLCSPASPDSLLLCWLDVDMRCNCWQDLTLELSHSNTGIGDGKFPKARTCGLLSPEHPSSPRGYVYKEAFGTYSLLTAFHSKAATSGVESRSQCLLGNIWHSHWKAKRTLNHCDLESGWGRDRQGGRYACKIASLCMDSISYLKEHVLQNTGSIEEDQK